VCISEEGIQPLTAQGSFDSYIEAWSWLKDTRLRQCSCRGNGPNGVHDLGGAMESMWACAEGCGVSTHLVYLHHLGALIVYDITLDPLLCTTSPWSLTCVPLERSTSLV
jgi:hypothetical protein